jgi:monoamine oxidase
LTKWFDALRSQEGRIYMSGSDVSEGWRGFIDGAIASGCRSANQVAKDLIA